MVKFCNYCNNLDCYIIILSMIFLIIDIVLNNNFFKLIEKKLKNLLFFL